MTKKNNDINNTKREQNKKRLKRKNKIIKSIMLALLTIFLFSFILLSITIGYIYTTIKQIPEFDPLNINSRLYENSVIYDDNGAEIEKVQTQEFRTIISINDMSDYLKNAFVAIEDERFNEHFGIDIKGLFRAVLIDIKTMSFKEGASTITQQLAKNIYLTKEKEISRKIKEMYIAIQIEKVLTKNQILEAYLNTIYLGQGANGVEAASQTYFSKSAKDLTLAESAIIAGITKYPARYELFKLYNPEEIDINDKNIVGKTEVLGKTYIAVFNEKSLERQKIILKKMLNLKMITKNEYENALNEDISKSIKPGLRIHEELETSYFNDYVKECVINDLINKKNMTKKEAETYLYTGGLKIYSTLNINIQSSIENIYDNFSDILNPNKKITNLVNLDMDKSKNILDSSGNIVFYKKNNILDENNDLIINKNDYSFIESGDLLIKSDKINYKNLDVKGFYELDKDNNLVTYSGRYLTIFKEDIYEDSYKIDENNEQILIKKAFLNKVNDFYKLDVDNNLLLNNKYIFNTEGILQPQSAVVVVDYTTGQVKGIVGGRGVKGQKIFNRATDAPRQPGSSIKPLSVYLPALDNYYTASTIIDDIPHFYNGDLWPKNWYAGYKGLVTLRYSVEWSINVNAVKVLEKLGIEKSMDYLEKFSIINANDPSSDTFITSTEAKESNSGVFDENIAALSLGGMTKGITPLAMTLAYSSIANDGVYIDPILYTKVVDRNNIIILENKPNKKVVVSPKVSYIMKDILKSVVTNGTGKNAQIYSGNKKIPSAGKTGTTQNKTDQWFVGFTPYYSCGVWVGNDNQSIKLGSGSNYATILWGEIMREIHKSKSPKDFIKPDGLLTKPVCNVSGKIPTELCYKDPRGSRVRYELYLKGTEPTEFCDAHVLAEIDPNTGLLVNEECPPQNNEYKVYIKRYLDYDPSSNLGIVPNDYKYIYPKEKTQCVEKPTETENIDKNTIDTEKNDDIIDSETNNEGNTKTPNKNLNVDIFDIIDFTD